MNRAKRSSIICSRHAPLVAAFLLSLFMTGIITLAVTLKAESLTAAFLGLWLSNWAFAWGIAFPIIHFAAPRFRRWVETCLVRPC